MKNPYTKEEKELMDMILDVHNKFCDIKRTHPDEMRDWIDGIHKCQGIIMMRITRRDYTNEFSSI